MSKFGSYGSGDGQFSSPYGIALDSTDKIYVADYGNNRVTVLFDPTLWTEAGEVILGTLALNQDLELNSGYNLIVKPMDNSTSGTIKTSDGKLTITNSTILIANAGCAITATSIKLSEGNLVVNTNMSFTNPLQVGSNNNNITVGDNISFSSDISYSAVGSLAVNEGITGNVDFAGNAWTLSLSNDVTVTGNVDSITSSAGTLEFLGKGTVTGSIGPTNALTKLKFSGAGDSTIPAASAGTIEIANAGA